MIILGNKQFQFKNDCGRLQRGGHVHRFPPKSAQNRGVVLLSSLHPPISFPEASCFPPSTETPTFSTGRFYFHLFPFFKSKNTEAGRPYGWMWARWHSFSWMGKRRHAFLNLVFPVVVSSLVVKKDRKFEKI